MFLRDGDHEVWFTAMGGSVLAWMYRDNYILGPVCLGPKVVPGQPSVTTWTRRGLSHWCFPNFGHPPDKPGFRTLPMHGFLRTTLLQPCRVRNQSLELWHTVENGALPDAHVGIVALLGSDPRAGSTHLNVRLLAYLQGDHTVGASYPVMPGWHPYFAGPATVKIGGRKIPVGPDSPPIVRVDPIIISLPFGQVTMIPSDNCHDIVVWSDDPKRYVCVEPVYGGRPGTFGTTEQATYLDHRHVLDCFVHMSFIPS